MASKYTVEVRDQYGRLVTTILRPMNKQFTLYRNKAGSCQFTMDLLDPQANFTNLQMNQYDIVFRRLGTPVFAGQLSYLDPSIDEDKKIVNIIATGYFDLLDQRHISSDFPNFDVDQDNIYFDDVDMGATLSDLLTYTQFPHTYDGNILMTGPSKTFAQSFIAQGTSTVETIKLLLKNTTATGTITFAFYNDNAGSLGTLVADSTLTVNTSTIAATLGWVTFTYPSTKPTLTRNNKYWLRITLTDAQSANCGINVYYLDYYTYSNGRAISPEDANLFTADENIQFFIQLSDNSYQMARNTYLGFLEGTIATSYNLTNTYDIYKKIKQIFEEAASTYNGLDFNFTIVIDPVTNFMKKYFNVFYPRQGIDNTSLPFYYPGNIIKISRPIDGKTVVNEVVERGQGSGLDQIIEIVDDSVSMQAYSLRQDVENQPDVPDYETLTSIGDEHLRIHKNPLDLPAFVLDGNELPAFGAYGIGDTITIIVAQSQAPLMQFAQNYRIEKLNVNISDDDKEFIEVTCSIA